MSSSVDKRGDVENIIGDLQWLLNYAAVVGQLPFLDSLPLKNPTSLAAKRYNLLNASSPVANFAWSAHCQQIGDSRRPRKVARHDQWQSRTQKLPVQVYKAHKRDPDFMTHERVLAVTVAKMLAGSDTTATTLRALFYNLSRHPNDMKSLMEEYERKGGCMT
ncbi:hypothetical protein LTR93_011796 [Exophiala xenobiotica]|nr:hypothetical protein LTR93_011796 [Exophiala xenobiotica]